MVDKNLQYLDLYLSEGIMGKVVGGLAGIVGGFLLGNKGASFFNSATNNNPLVSPITKGFGTLGGSTIGMIGGAALGDKIDNWIRENLKHTAFGTPKTTDIIEEMEKVLSAINDKIGECYKTSDPKVCKKKLNMLKNVLEDKLQNLRANMHVVPR